MKKHLLAVLAFAAATFITQAVSHFVVNADHYGAVTHIRKEPIFPLGILAMLIEGSVLSYLYKRIVTDGRSISNAVKFAWLAGAFLVSYIALAEAAKYSVPAVAPWITVEVISGFVQFTFYGVLLGFVYHDRAVATKTARMSAV